MTATALTRDVAEAAAARAGAVAAPADRPRERRSDAAHGAPALARVPLQRAEWREKKVDGATVLEFEGYASVTERGYEMWDFFGPYTEVVARDAFDATLARDPDVAFLLNHRGMTLARTKSGTLQLSADDTGLLSLAQLDPRITTVNDIRVAMERGDLDEMSFAFRITRGQWSPDYMEYRIEEVELDRGDVSVVNYGANPHTVGATLRGQDLRDLSGLPDTDLRALEQRVRTTLRSRGLAPAMSREELFG